MKQDIEGLNEVYQLIAQVTSVEDTLKLYQQFKGLTITFPTKLINREYIVKTLKKELMYKDKLSMKEIQNYARRFDYSERQIKRFIQVAKKEMKEASQIKEEFIPYVAEWLNNEKNKKDDERK